MSRREKQREKMKESLVSKARNLGMSESLALYSSEEVLQHEVPSVSVRIVIHVNGKQLYGGTTLSSDSDSDLEQESTLTSAYREALRWLRLPH